MITPVGDPLPWRYYVVYAFTTEAMPGMRVYSGNGYIWISMDAELDCTEQMNKVIRLIKENAVNNGDAPLDQVVVTNFILTGYPMRSAPPWAREAHRIKTKRVASEN